MKKSICTIIGLFLFILISSGQQVMHIYQKGGATNQFLVSNVDSIVFTGIQQETNTVIDIDGNVYHTVKIGTQVWMVENLKTTKYRDGTSIPNVTGTAQWASLNSGAYCDYNNDAAISSTYGRLYNWYTVIDSHNLAPVGWHVPTDDEWTTLTSYLGGENIAGGKLKVAGTTYWQSPNTGATNELGFSALPSGERNFDGNGCNYIGMETTWWTTTPDPANQNSWIRALFYTWNSVGRISFHKNGGYSVRCIKD
jgi:uncharacterized protein (TIGR02145 family)